jgi:hypothetical protein
MNGDESPFVEGVRRFLFTTLLLGSCALAVLGLVLIVWLIAFVWSTIA